MREHGYNGSNPHPDVPVFRSQLAGLQPLLSPGGQEGEQTLHVSGRPSSRPKFFWEVNRIQMVSKYSLSEARNSPGLLSKTAM